MIDWITLSQTAGTSGTTTITVSAGAYSELLNRNGSFTVRAADKSAVVTVKQGQDIYFNISPQFLTVPFEETSRSIDVYSDLPWSVSSKPAWCTLSANSGTGSQTLTLTVANNTGQQGRNGTITFVQNGTGAEKVMTVQQQFENGNITIVKFPCSGGSYTFSYASTSGQVTPPTLHEALPHGTNNKYSFPYNEYSWLTTSADTDNKTVTITCQATDAKQYYLSDAFSVVYYDHTEIIFISQEPCCFEKMFITNQYSVTSTTSPTKLMNINPACIDTITVDSVEKSMSDFIITQENMYNSISPALSYQFNTTGVHTIHYEGMELPKYGDGILDPDYGPQEEPVSLLQNLTQYPIRWDGQALSFRNLPNLELVSFPQVFDVCEKDYHYFETLLGYGCFENCRSLESISFDTHVKTIPYDCFKGCTSSTGVTFPDINGGNIELECSTDMFSGSGMQNLYFSSYDSPKVRGCVYEEPAPAGLESSLWYNFHFSGMQPTGVIHAPQGADAESYNKFLDHFPAGWRISYDMPNPRLIVDFYGEYPEVIWFPKGEGTTYEITVTSRVPWTASTYDNWVQLSQTSGSTGTTVLTLTAPAYPQGRPNPDFLFFRTRDYGELLWHITLQQN